jgi:selenocysteine lyase/cysteine desulfurase
MSHRRHFIRNASLLSTALLSGIFQPAWSRNLERHLKEADGISPADMADDDDFWYAIREAFVLPPNIVNLNSGGVSPAPRIVGDAMKQNFDYINQAPSYYMWRGLDQGRESLRINLAIQAGCDPGELAINRNASEGLDTVIKGLSLQRGDEVVLCRQDYNHAIFSWEQRAQRDGIKLVYIDLKLPSDDEAYMVQQYVSAFTPKTKLVQLTQVVNWNGQILPVAAVGAEARKRGIEVLVDGAHSFNHFAFRVADLNADYFVTSLHKWTYAPVGTGFLYVRKEKIGGLWPLLATGAPTSTDIRKFESLGTRPYYIEQAIGLGVDFNDRIGIVRKQQRLHYLKNYWMEQVKDLPGLHLGTSLSPRWAGAIGLFSIDGKKAADIDTYLFRQSRIHTTVTEWGGISGVRVTPNVFTTTKELDLLVKTIKSFIADYK